MENEVHAACSSDVQAIALRLRAGTDIRSFLSQYAIDTQLCAGCISSAVGSLSSANIRFAGTSSGQTLDGPLEVLSMSGSIGSGGVHLHLMVSDSSGNCLGGHILEGCLVNTTLELVILKLAGLHFDREIDPATGFLELKITEEKQSG